jgi:hypothetical protein
MIMNCKGFAKFGLALKEQREGRGQQAAVTKKEAEVAWAIFL